MKTILQAVGFLVVIIAFAAVAWMWNDRNGRDALGEQAIKEAHSAMVLHLAAADSLRQKQEHADSMYVMQFAAFQEEVASLAEFHQREALHQHAIASIPADSLPMLVRRFIADAKRLGFLLPQ